MGTHRYDLPRARASPAGLSQVPHVRRKAGCTLDPIAPGGIRILAAVDEAAMAVGVCLTLTAGTNGHTSGRHPLGEALDLSVAGLSRDQIVGLYRYLKDRLGAAFTVLYETPTAPTPHDALRDIATVNPLATAPHLHCQVAKGTTFPPLAT